MKRAFLPSARHVGLILLLFAGVALGVDDEFYLNRLRSGQEALRQSRTAAAADELRVACFGLMDSPPLLMECLISLANAQSGAGRDEDLALTLARVLEVEGKFRVYGALNIDPAFRATFEGNLVKKMSREALSSVPEFARLVAEPSPRATEKPTRAERRRAAERAAEPPAAPAAPVVVATAPPVAENEAPTAEPPVEPAPTPVPIRAPIPTPVPTSIPAAAPAAREAPAPNEAETLAAARRLVAERKYGEAAALVEAALAGASGSRALRKQHLETLVMQKRWQAAAEAARKLLPLADGEETSIFYAAVALFEVGQREEAKSLIQLTIGKVAASPYVDYYVSRITGHSR